MRLNLPPSRPVLWCLYAAACASFLATLGVPYIGEEAVYTITSLEMRASGEYFVTTLYGTNYGRPPLLNWLVISIAELTGWDRVLVASRIVTAGASVATGLVVAWLASRLTGNDTFGALAAVVFMTGDVLFYRGWLAYADSLFTLCVFGAIACLWVSVHERRPGLAWLAACALTCGYLAKVQTAYLFYGVAWCALALNPPYRRELLRPGSIAAQAAAVAAFVAWQAFFTHGAHSATTMTDIVLKARAVDLAAYSAQLLWFPVETVLRFLPASGVAIYCLWRAQREGGGLREPPVAGYAFTALLAILAVNYAPYWLWPNSHIRYVMPLYPLAALLVAHGIWRAGERPAAAAVKWFVAAITLKYVAAFWLYPAYHERYRADYAAVAADVLGRAGGHALYSNDTTATSLSVVAHIDQARYPAAPVRWPPREWRDGWLLARKLDPAAGRPVREYSLGRNVLYLVCRGAACEGEAR